MKKYYFSFLLILFTSTLWSQQNASCSTWTFDANYQLGPYRNVPYDIVQLTNSNFVVVGLEQGATYMGRLTKVNSKGEGLITRYIPVGTAVDLWKIKEFTNGNLYSFGSEYTITPFTRRPTLVIIDSSNFNFTVKSLLPTIGATMWQGADIAEGENNTVYVFSYSESEVNITKLDGTNSSVTWSRSYQARNSPRGIGIGVSGNTVYASWNETDSGYSKGVMMAIDAAAGDYMYGCRVGGGSEKLNIELQSMTMANGRPSISGLQWKDNLYQSIRLNYTSELSLENKEIFDIPGLNAGKETITRQYESGRILVHQEKNISTEIYLSTFDPANNQEPFVTSKFSYTFPTKFKSATSTNDRGIVMAIQDDYYYDQIKLTKTDSRGNLPGCGNTNVFGSYKSVAQSFQKDTINAISIKFFTSVPTVLPSNNFLLRTIYKCSTHVPSVNSLDLGKDSSLCPGNSLKLTAGKGFDSYLWQDGTTDSILIAKTPGLYHVQVTSCGGVILKDSITITATSPIPFSAGPDRVKCLNDTVHLSATPGFINYQWSNNYNINSLNSQSVVVNPKIDTSYYVKAEKTVGCFAFDTVRISVVQSPSINLGKDTSFCAGNSVVLNSGNGFSNYLWSDGSTNPQLEVKSSGTYSVIGTDQSGCKSYDTIRVLNVWSLPVPKLDQSPELCASSVRILDPGSFNSYLWNDGSTNNKLLVSGVGKYFVEVRDVNNCIGSDTTIINLILPAPAQFLPPDTSICSFNTLTIHPAQSYSSYQWSSGGVSPSLTVDKAGLYWLEVTDSKNCKGRDSILVTPKQCVSGVYVPTAFSPGNDRKNHVFRPLVSGPVTNLQFTVYDRWGQVIFHTKEANKGWNGELHGKQLPVGVYVWICSYEMDGKKQMQRGTVLLIR